MNGRVIVLQGDARALPLPDASVDLIVTSPPYFGLRSYTDGGEHYAGQIGSEATPQEWLAALVVCTAEWLRVLKPEGSMFVNLGDKYSSAAGPQDGLSEGSSLGAKNPGSRAAAIRYAERMDSSRGRAVPGTRPKCLLGLPWRYALACTDQLGLILRAEIIWAKPNGLPESVTDRVRRAHEQVFHFTRQPRYYSAVDEIREEHTSPLNPTRKNTSAARSAQRSLDGVTRQTMDFQYDAPNPLGKLPSSVWSIPSQPLVVPPALGIDHFACVDADTEILTPRGWLRHDQLTEGEQVAGYDLDSDTARWTECTAVSRYGYDGDLIAAESRDLSVRLTPNHRTIVQRMHTRANKRSPVSVIRADELDHRHFIPRSAAWRPSGDSCVGERLAAVMGWVAAEGWYQGTSVWLSQSLDVNAQHVIEIDGLMPAPAVRTERKRTYKGRPWTEVTWKLGAMGALVQSTMPDKLLPWWLTTSTEPERRAVLDAFIAGDGHRRPDGRIGIYQKHRHNLDVLQAIAVTLGYKTTLREGGGRFVLYLTEGGRSVTLRGTSGVGSKVRREHYTGTVWCPTTGTGTFIARRNGSVFVTGNSFPMELPRRVILGWSPPGVCVACGQGRRPVVATRLQPNQGGGSHGARRRGLTDLARPNGDTGMFGPGADKFRGFHEVTVTGYVCACTPHTDHPGTGETSGPSHGASLTAGDGYAGTGANWGGKQHLSDRPRVGPWREYHHDQWTPPPTRPAVVLDPFGGTGTTALVAAMHGRTGISVDRSADYTRLATWRCQDPAERAKALQVPKPPPIPDGMEALF